MHNTPSTTPNTYHHHPIRQRAIVRVSTRHGKHLRRARDWYNTETRVTSASLSTLRANSHLALWVILHSDPPSQQSTLLLLLHQTTALKPRTSRHIIAAAECKIVTQFKKIRNHLHELLRPHLPSEICATNRALLLSGVKEESFLAIILSKKARGRTGNITTERQRDVYAQLLEVCFMVIFGSNAQL